MSQRIRRLLTLTVDLYNPNQELTRANKRFQGSAASSTPTVSGAPARIFAKSDVSIPSPVGRSNVDQMDTTDVIELKNETPCGDGWYAHVTAPSDYPEVSTWLKIEGGPQQFMPRKGLRHFLVSRTTQPAWIA